MEWYSLFREHILNRGAEYHQDGRVSLIQKEEQIIEAEVEGTECYHVSIELSGEEVAYMTCDCPYAEDGSNCKHMAAVLFQMEEELSNSDFDDEEDEYEDEPSALSWQEKCKKQREQVIELVNNISEAEVRELLVNQVLVNESLRNNLELKYMAHMNHEVMTALKRELKTITEDNSYRGFVDWQHAYDFTSELRHFLESRVKFLIERNYLEQAFELTNMVFHCVGTIDMDDSGGGSTEVADDCYECWKLILEKSDEKQKAKMEEWFKRHQSGYVIDFIEEYLLEFLSEEFLTKDLICEKIKELDELIADCKESHECVKLYSTHYGYEDVILKRIEYMRMLNCTEAEIIEFRQNNRQFLTVRELEIREAIDDEQYEKAIQLLLESKKFDEAYPQLVKKYSEQLIDLYCRCGDTERYCEELQSHLENYYQKDLNYFRMLKMEVGRSENWETIVNRILDTNQNLHFVCEILNEEKRYEELMARIQKDNNIYLLDKFEKNLRKALPNAVVALYKRYVLEEVGRVSDRNGYRGLMKYLQKIAKCEGGKEVATNIAQQWRVEYKRRSAMMDELRKIGL